MTTAFLLAAVLCATAHAAESRPVAENAAAESAAPVDVAAEGAADDERTAASTGPTPAPREEKPRRPLPVPGGVAAPRPASQPQPAPEPAPAGEWRSFAVTFGVAALYLWPSIELEWAFTRHVSAYGGLEGAVFPAGGGGQVGLRLHPLDGVEGPFLDAHLRWSQYDGIFTSRSELANPGLMFGWTWIRDSGFAFSAGIGCNFAAQVSTTSLSFTSSGGYVPLPIPSLSSSRETTGQLEARLQLGYAF